MNLDKNDFGLWTSIHIIVVTLVMFISMFSKLNMTIPIVAIPVIAGLYWFGIRLLEMLWKSDLYGELILMWLIITVVSTVLNYMSLALLIGEHFAFDVLIIYHSVHLSYFVGKSVREVKVIKE